MLNFIIGVIVGAPLGLITMALLTAAKKADIEMKKDFKEAKKNDNTRSM